MGDSKQMKSFTLSDIRNLITQALLEQPTGDLWLDSRYAEQKFVQGLTMPYYKLFYLLAQALKPELVVELGSFQATGAAHFALGNPASTVLTIDIHRDDQEAKQRTIEAAHRIPNLRYCQAWTWDAPNVDWVKEILKQPISILYIDAWHEYQYIKREWDLYSPLLANPALVICDDITADFNFEGMGRFWDELPGEKFLFDQGLHGHIPMGFLRYSKSYEEGFERGKKIIEDLANGLDQDRGIDTIKSATPTKRGRGRPKSGTA